MRRCCSSACQHREAKAVPAVDDVGTNLERLLGAWRRADNQTIGAPPSRAFNLGPVRGPDTEAVSADPDNSEETASGVHGTAGYCHID